MAFFQNSVVEKYIKGLNKPQMQAAYLKFKEHFHNPIVQENIRNSKEEQYQEGFFRDLFVAILGYTLNPNTNFNLTTEYKNVKDSKKADGAILIADKVKAVIELKGTNTTDLGRIETQAFGYKNNQPDCVYIITSNFEKIRFYIDNAIEHLEFNLFTLNEKEFELLYLCLAYENIEKGLGKKIKDESLSQEDTITKHLYKDYSLFKRELHQNLVLLNPEIDSLLLFKESQKLLDRFLFLFFAEDRQLLPPNSVRLILNDWRELQERDVMIPLYDRYKKYFEYLNTGYKGKRYDVFAYNGGLFKPDEVLDNVIIDDELLFKHTYKLSEYDFASEVDVNILGHIFENSLNELDEIKAQLEGQEIDKSKSKRKKDGVFYTPKYITKYIVENTIGKLCTEKKSELLIIEEEYTTDKKRTAKLKQSLFEKLTNYRNYLLQLTICDPACGSGAFLNQALDFLIAEHRYVDELQAKLFGDSLVLTDVEKSILEHNLFGVDLNEESVEIAKLSLWLRTAQPNRKLNNLNDNIKCGNSLIDDPAVAGEKAFNWQSEFPQVFENGGFDVVIGNPPYGAFVNNVDEKTYYNTNYKTRFPNYDTYGLFFEKAYFLLKEQGLLGFITPNTYLVIENGVNLRKFLFEKCNIHSLLETFNVFPDAVVEPITIILSKETPKHENTFTCFLLPRGLGIFQVDLSILQKLYFNHHDLIEREDFIFNYRATIQNKSLANKISKKASQFSEIAKITAGVKPYEKGKGQPAQSAEIVTNKPYTSFKQEGDGWLKLIRGTQVNRYLLNWDGEYIKYGECLAAPRNETSFYKPKLFIRRTDDRILAVYDEDKIIGLNSIHCLQTKEKEISLKFLLCILNSKVINWFFQFQNFHMVGKPMAEVKVVFVERLPIIISENQLSFISMADKMLLFSKEFSSDTQKFQRALQRKFELDQLPTKLQNWYTLSFKEFIAELGKKKVKLTLGQEAEWEDFFLSESKKALEIKAKIEATDKEIDRMVYALYELTEEEIKIVEGEG